MTTIPDDVTTDPAPLPAACVARPWSGFVHLDGVCACFYGGPAPVFTTPADRAA